MSEPEKWVNLETVAEHTGLSKDTIRNYIKRKVIPYYRIGKQYKFKLSEIDAWIQSGESAKVDVEQVIKNSMKGGI